MATSIQAQNFVNLSRGESYILCENSVDKLNLRITEDIEVRISNQLMQRASGLFVNNTRVIKIQKPYKAKDLVLKGNGDACILIEKL